MNMPTGCTHPPLKGVSKKLMVTSLPHASSTSMSMFSGVFSSLYSAQESSRNMSPASTIGATSSTTDNVCRTSVALPQSSTKVHVRSTMKVPVQAWA